MPFEAWETVKGDTHPYIDWFNATERRANTAARFTDLKLTLSDRTLEMFLSAPQRKRLQLFGIDAADSSGAARGTDAGVAVPIPSLMANGNWSAFVSRAQWDKVWHRAEAAVDTDFGVDDLTMPDDGAIIGIIDSGIALGHHRFRQGTHKTRILAAWQQSARFGGDGGAGQEFLPFGQEIYQPRIEDALTQHSRADGSLDEDAFNRALNLVDPQWPEGHRDLDHRVAHGTHMADLAAGAEAGTPFSQKTRIIAVNLPPQILHGTAGNFLHYYAVYALHRIVALANRIAAKNGKQDGYPVFVNLSYGIQAGPKDSALPLEEAVQKLKSVARNTFDVFIPAGNDNLQRGAAYIRSVKSKPQDLPNWQVQPSDSTSNFIEIWFRAKSGGTLQSDRLEIRITAPGGAVDKIALPPLLPGETRYRDIAVDEHRNLACARIYARTVMARSGHSHVNVVLCLAPTQSWSAEVPQARAGAWKVTVASSTPCSVEAYIQSDQSRFVHSKTGLRSYFDDPGYRTYDEAGRVIDSHLYPCPPGKRNSSDPRARGIVTRTGTLNALAAQGTMHAVAGYRVSDGRPAAYSSTGWKGRDSGIAMAFPSEDAPSLFGVLASGARDGSIAALRGTSAACAMATRDAVSVALGLASSTPLKMQGGGAARAKVGNKGRRVPATGPLCVSRTGQD